MKFNRHHISYDKTVWPEWTVNIPGYFHRTITFLSRMKATPENYAILTDCMHSITHEWNKMRMELDVNEEE